METRQTMVAATRELLNTTEGWLVRVKNAQGRVTLEETYIDWEEAMNAFNRVSGSHEKVTLETFLRKVN